MLKKIVGLVFVLSVVMTTGCATFKGNNIPEVTDTDYKVTNSEKVKVFSRWKFETTSSLINGDASAAVHKSWFERAVKESDCCYLVEGPTEADLIIDSTLKDDSSSAALIPAFITGLSLYIIPSWVTGTIDLSVKADSSKQSKAYEVYDSFKLVQWLPMLFAYPFTGGAAATRDEMYLNAYKYLIVQMKNDGFL